MKLYSVNAGNFKLDGGAMFGVVPKSLWQRSNPADINNMCSWAMRCLLIEDGNKLILIDNGMGDKQSAKFFSHYYLHGDDSLKKSFKKNGFCFDDVTDVILSHLHFDHCGGSVYYDSKKSLCLPTFKNAIYWSNKKHWNWAINPNSREKASFLKENILPIKESGQLKFVEEEGALFDNISIKFVFGHTEAQMIPYIKYQGKTIIFTADLLPSTGHIPLPYVMGYDIRPLVTLTEKQQFLLEASKNNYILFLEHDNYTECCTLKDRDGRVILDEKFHLKDCV